MYRKYYNPIPSHSKSRDTTPDKVNERRSFSQSQPLHDFTNMPLQNFQSNLKGIMSKNQGVNHQQYTQSSSVSQQQQRELPKRIKTANNTPERSSANTPGLIRTTSVNKSQTSSARYEVTDKANKSIGNITNSSFKEVKESLVKIGSGPNSFTAYPLSAGQNNRRRTSHNGLSSKTTISKNSDTLRGLKSFSQNQSRTQSKSNVWSVLGIQDKFNPEGTNPFLSSVTPNMIDLNSETHDKQGKNKEDVRKSIDEQDKLHRLAVNSIKFSGNPNYILEQQSSSQLTQQRSSQQKPDNVLSKYLKALAATEKSKKAEQNLLAAHDLSYQNSELKKSAIQQKKRKAQSNLFKAESMEKTPVDMDADAHRILAKSKTSAYEEAKYFMTSSNNPPPRSFSSNSQHYPQAETMKSSTSAKLRKKNSDSFQNFQMGFQGHQSFLSDPWSSFAKKQVVENRKTRANSTNNVATSTAHDNYMQRLSNVMNRTQQSRSNSSHLTVSSYSNGSSYGANLHKPRNSHGNVSASTGQSQQSQAKKEDRSKKATTANHNFPSAIQAYQINDTPIRQGGMDLLSSTRTRKGVMASNPKKVNQDSIFMSERMRDDEYDQIYLLGVMDGHGSNGHFVSQFIKNHIQHEYLLLQRHEKDYATKLSKMTDNLHTKLASSQIDCQFSGTTMVTLLLLFKKNTLRIFSCNCGDSRAIMGLLKSVTQSQTSQPSAPISQNTYLFEVLELTRDHKPELPDERTRILASNGRIDSYRDEYGNQLGPMRVWLQNENIPGIAMSRSLGDNVATSVGVTWEAEIKEFQIKFNPPQSFASAYASRASTPIQGDSDKKEDEELIEAERGFIIIGSDGVWEFLSNVDIVREVGRYYVLNDIEGACDWLMQESYSKWTSQDDSVVDDITFNILFISHQTGIAMRNLSMTRDDLKNTR